MADGDKLQGIVDCETMFTDVATTYTIMVYPIKADHTVMIRVEVLAQRFDTGEDDEVYSYVCDHIFNKAGAASAVLRGSGTPVEIDPQSTGWVITVDADGDDARVRVTGTASEDVRWIGRIHQVLDVEQQVVA